MAVLGICCSKLFSDELKNCLAIKEIQKFNNSKNNDQIQAEKIWFVLRKTQTY
jgi:hypothetical protein